MKSPEGYEKDDITKFLDKFHIWYFKAVMGPFGKGGVPDIISCVPVLITQDMVGKKIGVFTSIEVKREGKGPTPLQTTRMQEIASSFGITVWGTAEKVIRELKTIFQLK